MHTYTDQQLDALGELASIGSRTAATALSGMIGQPVAVSVPNAVALSLAGAVDAAGNPEAPVVAISLPVQGDLDGVALILLSQADAAAVCGILGVAGDPEMELSALGEIGNIVGASYLGALGMTIGMSITPGLPKAGRGSLGTLVASVLRADAETAHTVLRLDSSLTVAEVGCSLSIMVTVKPGLQRPTLLFPVLSTRSA